MSTFLLPAPSGFVTDPKPDDPDGPITAAQFDSNVGEPGASASLGYQSGYNFSYIARDDSGAGLEITITRFATPAQAAAFVVQSSEPDSTDPTREVAGTDSAIPGSHTVNSTKTDPSSDGETDDYVVNAYHSRVVIFVDYYTDNIEASGPATAAAYALAQYKRL